MLDRNRLSKMLGMLGSAHDGEAINAGRAADHMVRQAGMTWEQVVTPPQPQYYYSNQKRPARPVPSKGWRKLASQTRALYCIWAFFIGIVVLLITLFAATGLALGYLLLVVIAATFQAKRFLFGLLLVPGTIGTVIIVGIIAVAICH